MKIIDNVKKDVEDGLLPLNEHKRRSIPLNAGPVAQSVERWTPCGGSTRPGFKSPGFEARRAPDVYRASCGYGCGWWQAVASQSSDRDRPCAAMCVR